MKKLITALVGFLPLMLIFFVGNAVGAVKGAQQGGNGSGKILQSKGQVNAPKGTPTWEIQEIERKLEEYDTSPGISAAQKAKNRKLKRGILSGAFDLRELSKLSLDRHWNSISGGEQSSFVNLMLNLLRHTLREDAAQQFIIPNKSRKAEKARHMVSLQRL